MVNTVAGGYNNHRRLDSAEHCLTLSPYSPILIDGLHKNGETAHQVSTKQVEDLLPPVIKTLGNEVPYFIYGGLLPPVTVSCVLMGADVFDTSYPALATERNSALTFQYRYVFKKAKPLCNFGIYSFWFGPD